MLLKPQITKQNHTDVQQETGVQAEKEWGEI